MSFICIQSLRIEFEVGINPCATAKRAMTDYCVLDLKCGPKHWQARNMPVHNGDRGIIQVGIMGISSSGGAVDENALLYCIEGIIAR